MRSGLWMLAGAIVSGLFGCGAPPTPPATPPANVSPLSAATPLAPPAGDPELTVTREPAAAEPAWRKAVTVEPKTWAETQTLIESLKGKIVVVDVWSTACEPCLREFPNLVTLQNEHPQDVVCIGFNCDFAGIRKKPPEFYRERVLKALTERDAKIINVMCTEPADELFVTLKIDSIPAVFLYNRDGQLVQTFDNQTNQGGEFTYAADVLPAVENLLLLESPAVPQ